MKAKAYPATWVCSTSHLCHSNSFAMSVALAEVYAILSAVLLLGVNAVIRPFSASLLFVGWQEGHLACKNPFIGNHQRFSC